MKRHDTINFIGDKEIGKTFIPVAKQHLATLENLMKFQELKQCKRLVEYDNGIKITCFICYGHGVADIYVPIDLAPQQVRNLSCYTIQIIFFGVETNPSFIDFCNDRIAEINQMIDWMDYLKDTFLPAYIEHAYELTNYAYTYVDIYPVFWTEELIDAVISSFTDYFTVPDVSSPGSLTKWDKQRAAFVAALDAWEDIRDATTRIEELMTITAIENSGSSTDVYAEPIAQATITIRCDETSWTDPEYDFTGYSQEQIDRIKSSWGETLWDASTDCAPLNYINVQVPNTARLSIYAKGFVNQSTGQIHLVSTDHEGEIAYTEEGWLETLKFIFGFTLAEDAATEQFLLSYPVESEFTISTLPVPTTIGDRDPLDPNPDFYSNFSVTGRLLQAPTSFGATIGTWTAVEDYLGATLAAEGEFVQVEEGYNFFSLLFTTDGMTFADLKHREVLLSLTGGTFIQEQ